MSDRSHNFAGALVLFILLFCSIPLLQGKQLLVDAVGADFRVTKTDGSFFQARFFSIQEAINSAENGSVIQVPAGVYTEHVTINKTVSLVGENVGTTIIDGNNGGTVVQVLAPNVSVSGFTIRYSGWGWTNNGIYVYSADNCEIRNNFLFVNCHNIRLNYSRGSRVVGNIIDGNGYGIRFLNSENCTATDNKISNCIGGVHLEYATNCTVNRNCFTQNGQGIRFYSPCAYNQVFENLVFNNTYDGMIELMPGNTTLSNNFIFHNNFINNTYPFIYTVYGTIWDDGYPSGGNYWTRYNGTDLHSGPYQNETGPDGLGDTQYAINSYDADRYPLMQPYGSVRNLDTNLTYLTIHDAIDAPETSDGQTISVKNGVYDEHLVINKSVALVGEDLNMTIIDGGGIGTVVTVGADNVSICNLTVLNGGSDYPPYGNDCGILLDHRTGCNLSRIQVTDNRIGIYLFFSTDTILEGNLVQSNHESGIWLWCSGRNTLRENTMLDNTYNFGVFGTSHPDFENSIDSSNLVDNRPIRYLIGAENQIYDSRIDAGVMYLVDCFNVTVCDLDFRRNGHGVFCFNVTQSEIRNVTTAENNYGICIQKSSNNTIKDNLDVSDWVGICLQSSTDIDVENNIVVDAEKALSLYEASNNRIEGNMFNSSLYGIRLFSSNQNLILHNNIINNTEQVDSINSYENLWDNGLEGNFWSGYMGSDSNRDGVNDIPYAISGGDHDRYPLLGSFRSFQVGFENDSMVTVITNSSLLSFNLDERNKTIRLTVDGLDGTYGFCRMSIPKSFIGPSVEVIIDDGLTQVLYANYSIYNDGFRDWIYFAYYHSSHTIAIIPESLVPMLSLALLSSTACVLCTRKRGRIEERSETKH